MIARSIGKHWKIFLAQVEKVYKICTNNRKTLENIFGTKKFYLEIQMRFKEASHEEIESHDKLKMKFSLEEAKNNFQTVSTVKLLLRNSSR